MTTEELRSILSIAHDWSDRGAGRSLSDLLSSTRYRELRPTLRVEALEQQFEADHHLIEQWVAYSQDKRTRGGWWFQPVGAEWEVGRFGDSGADTSTSDRFSKPSSAAAAYVLRELDFWANLAAR
ncbi:MAG TPA: hypothetical protein VNO50_14860 [Pyrinomonadaceae bacterium]|nr:hypothetical protein [Pyrinomonadaceae bacterium]